MSRTEGSMYSNICPLRIHRHYIDNIINIRLRTLITYRNMKLISKNRQI